MFRDYRMTASYTETSDARGSVSTLGANLSILSFMFSTYIRVTQMKPIPCLALTSRFQIKRTHLYHRTLCQNQKRATVQFPTQKRVHCSISNSLFNSEPKRGPVQFQSQKIKPVQFLTQKSPCSIPNSKESPC